MSKKNQTRSESGPEWERVHLQNYANSVSRWTSWFDAADELQFAAEMLKPQVVAWWAGMTEWQARVGQVRKFPALGCHSIVMMLLAYVVEDLCKGVMIRDRIVDVSTAGLIENGIPRQLKTHNLRALVRLVGMPTDDQEQELLQRMTRASVWRARYPAPVEYDDAIHTLKLDTGAKHSAAWFGGTDIDRIESFIAQLRQHLGVVRSYTVARDAAP